MHWDTKLQWLIYLSDKMIEREDHEAAAQLLRDYSHGYGNLGTVGGYGECASAPHAGLVYDRRLGAVTHRKGTDLGIRMKRRKQALMKPLCAWVWRCWRAASTA